MKNWMNLYNAIYSTHIFRIIYLLISSVNVY